MGWVMATMLLVMTHPLMFINFWLDWIAPSDDWNIWHIMTFQGKETCCISKCFSLFLFCFCFFLWVDKFNDFVAYRSLDCQCVFTRCVHYNPFGRGVEWGGFDRTSCIIHQKLSKSKRWKLCSAPVEFFLHFCFNEPTNCQKQHSTKSFQNKL